MVFREINKMQRWKLTLEYDGTGFNGWQGENGIFIFDTLKTAIYQLTQENTTPVCAGRTDAGVHALNQVVHFDLKKPFTSRTIIFGLNYHLNNKFLSVLDAETVPLEFSARFSVKYREYKYLLSESEIFLPLLEKKIHCLKKININRIEAALEFLSGYFPMYGFCAAKSYRDNMYRSLKCFLTIEYFLHRRIYILNFRAKSFVHHQIRFMVGAILEYNRGIDKLELYKNNLGQGPKPPLAPAHALYLSAVIY